jgi:hypothetical protein
MASEFCQTFASFVPVCSSDPVDEGTDGNEGTKEGVLRNDGCLQGDVRALAGAARVATRWRCRFHAAGVVR